MKTYSIYINGYKKCSGLSLAANALQTQYYMDGNTGTTRVIGD